MIVLTGGGNFGDLYPRYEALRRRIVKLFPHNKIVMFPQSIWYTSEKELDKSKEIYGQHSKLTLLAREQNTYDKMKQYYPRNRVELVPYIVFYLSGKVTCAHKIGCAVCLRDDSEGVIDNNGKNAMLDCLKQQYGAVAQITTANKQDNLIGELRKKLVLLKLEEFTKNELVVTDRLHGMIFSFVTGTPCIALPSKTGKTEDMFNTWLRYSGSCVEYRQEITGVKIEIPQIQPGFEEMIKKFDVIGNILKAK